MNIVKRYNRQGDKAYFSIEYGRDTGKRMATGIYIYTRPKDKLEKKHNKEALLLVATKKTDQGLSEEAKSPNFALRHQLNSINNCLSNYFVI